MGVVDFTGVIEALLVAAEDNRLLSEILKERDDNLLLSEYELLSVCDCKDIEGDEGNRGLEE